MYVLTAHYLIRFVFMLSRLAIAVSLVPVRMYYGRNRPPLVYLDPVGDPWVRVRNLGSHTDYQRIARTWYGRWYAVPIMMRNYGGTPMRPMYINYKRLK